ncbi:MAG: hypothetical protein KGL39_37290, partial [Patescibacteria group bacterium]|nr:hypothetical protein [Patescibacteria group bacterium]
MADFKSIPLPFKLRGMNLTLPPDQLPPDQAAALVNVRPQGSGQVVSSPGTTNVNAVALADTNIHSLSRLNDFSPGAANSWLRLIGAGTNLYSGQTSFAAIQSGFSGNPLSFSFARPSQAVSTWAYIADSAQMKKTNSGNLIRDMGIRIIPTGFPAVLFTPAINQTFVSYDFSSLANFSVSGTASTLASGSRLSATNIAPYNPLISNKIGLPNPSDFDQLGVGSVLNLSIGGAVRVNARHQIGNTSTQTLQAQSDGGAGSEMSVSIPASLGVEAGTLVTIGPGGSQITSYVQTAVASLEGQDCLRMFTGTTVYSGATAFAFTSTLEVSGVISGTTTVSSYEVSFTVTAGTGACYLSGSLAGFGAMLPTQNVHVSININEPEFVTNLVLMMSLGNTPTSAGAYAFAVIDASTLVPGEWTEIFIPQGAFTFVGDPHDLNANGYISLQIITTGQVNVAWGSLTFDTSSGPDAGDFGQPYFYRCRFRDPTTGATSITFPASTTAILPRNIPLDVLGPSYTPGGYLGGTLVVDFERFGGSLTSWNYVATATGNGFYDIYPDSAIATNGPLTPVFPPFPVLGNPITGSYKIIGISLIWVSGGTIPLNLAPGTLINVADASNNTTQTLTLAAVINASTTIALTVEPFQGDPTQTYTITIPNPILLNTPLPVMWGPYPQGLFNFCVGDPLNPGSLYVTNANDPDSSSDANTIEITSPNEPLMNGAILGSDSFVITSDRLLLLQATFTDFASGSGNLFQAQDIPASKGHGLTDTYAFCVGGGAIWWKASDGIYCYDGAVRNISDTDLWPLFQHGGQPAQSVTIGGAGGGLSVTVPPPQVGTNRNRLCYKDGRLYFDYIAQGTGNPYTLIYDIRTQGWWLDIAPLATLAPRVRFDESSEDLIQTPTELLLGIGNGFVAIEGGSTYSGTAFNSLLFTGTLGVGELTRSEKQWGDLWFDISSPGVSTLTIATYANFYESLISTSSLSASAGRNSYNVDLNTGGGFLAKNVAIGLEWSPGLSLFQWAPSLVVKPETTNLRATDWDNAGSPQAKYIMGCEIECDTLGVNQIVNIETEGGGVAATVTLNANGQQVLAFALPPFIAHDIRLAPTSNVPWRFFGVRWINQLYPEDTTQFTEWSDA